jgi:predicted P-loop ATPase
MTNLKITHDGTLDIATAGTSRSKTWKNRQWTWSEFVKKLSETHRTHETHAEYMAAKKPRQDEIKNIGGFVGGYLAGGKRKSGSITHRQVLTLDVDFGDGTFWAVFSVLFGCSAVLYSTHKHTPDSPRLRLIIPLDREVFADEYEAIARKIAGMLDIEVFDPTTFQPERLMYWPSTSKDGVYVFEFQDGPWLCADEVLAMYTDWRDSSEWPVSVRVEKAIRSQIGKKQKDPLQKKGIVGTFCRTYSIHQVIETFLGDVYEPCGIDDRYTYKEGSTAAGLITYDDKFAYSHHGTDPSSGHLCNAFDLVRIHKFADLDENSHAVKEIELPSYKAMVDFAREDAVVKSVSVFEKISEAKEDFTGIEMDEEEPEELDAGGKPLWYKDLEISKTGEILGGIDNVVTILKNDPLLKGRIIFDEFDQRETACKDLPWRSVRIEKHLKDGDVSNLKHFLKVRYKVTATTVTLEDSLKVIYDINKVNTVKDYLDSLEWDGRKRLDQLFIDYLGAEDCEYTRAITRKMLVAAVTRIYEPGAKFDYMLIIMGKQGIGKSTLIAKLGGKWFTDSFSFQMLDKGNKAYEQLQGAWLVEAGELTGLKKADVNAAKTFITSTEDRYRVSYGRRISFFPRQCVFFGTTNDIIFLRDQTGNRRFPVLRTLITEPEKSIFTDLTRGEVNQIWAEARAIYRGGKEPLYLTPELEDIAESIRSGHTETDERMGMVQAYLDTLLPENWDEMTIYQRRAFLQNEDPTEALGTVERQQVCVAEIWCEMLSGKLDMMTTHNTKFIHEILQNLDGWKPTKGTRRFKKYGQQRAYERVKVTTKTGRLGGNTN